MPTPFQGQVKLSPPPESPQSISRRNKAGRPFPVTTPVGRMIAARNLNAITVSRAAEIHPRVMTEILAGRVQPNPGQVTRLCQVLDCRPEDLLDSTDASADGAG